MKFYKVIKENFLWDAGAILKQLDNGKGYVAKEDIYKKLPESDEYISNEIIENSPEYFQRVYEVNLATRVVYELKDRAKELLQEQFKA